MGQYQKIYDITTTLGGGAVNWPGNPPYSRELVSRLEDGQSYTLSKITLPTHIGTHVDTPSHFIIKGKTLDDYPIERWILPALVVDIKDQEVIRPSELENLDLEPGDALLFKTANSAQGLCVKGEFVERYVHMSPESADLCVARKLSMVGIDYASVEKYGLPDAPAHYKLLGNDILILEGLNLKDVPPGKYTLFCLPMKIKGAEGAPARAVLVC
jgi:arylformamidase